MLDKLAPGYEIKVGRNHRYKVHYGGKIPFFLDKGKGGATGNRADRGKVQIRIKKVTAMLAYLELCFECARHWFPDVRLPSDKADIEKATYCSEHKAKLNN